MHFVSIADFLMGLQPKPDKFDELARQLKNFASEQPVTIRSAQKLAELMAAKAAIIKDEIGIALGDDPELRTNLAGQFKSFKADLLPNLTTGEFADIYAETITYGMFAARLHDESLDTFSRQEALELLPKSNPFLRDLFGYIAGPALPDRLRYIVDDLAAVLRASDPFSLFEDFGKFTARNDPFVHFYETFLAEYNPKKRKSRGVWYTPEPVVDFIVRAVDDVLKTEFGLKDGLADTSKVSVKWDTGNDHVAGRLKGQPIIENRQVHRVQILDPATGTGTFLAKTIQTISDRVKARAPGKWSGYVEDELIPRIHGFELLMASYAMCHMKLDMMLRETGYTPSDKPPRLSVWLTNALEEGEREVRDLFFAPLANEARGANDVKRQTPIMCIIGNPPYSGESANKGDYIMNLMDAYKKEPGGKEKLKERNPKWINDDYVKFIRMSENMIAQNAEGVLGFITNHGYLDNPTFRGMRWHLLNTFDKIYVLDLHGNSKKKEVSPDGSPDKNVFDIQQGVALFVGVKKAGAKKNKPLAQVWHGDLWGSRKKKNEELWTQKPDDLSYELLTNKGPEYPFELRDHRLEESYLLGFSVAELFPISSVGIVTSRDSLSIDSNKSKLWDRIKDFQSGDPEFMRTKYSLGKDVQDWSIERAQADISKNFSEKLLVPLAYRPFDTRWTYFTGNSRGFHCRPRENVMRHLKFENIGLVTARSNKNPTPDHFFITNTITEAKLGESSTQSSVYPLYLYPGEKTEQGDAFASTGRTVNFDPKIYAAICEAGGLEGNTVRAEPVEAHLPDKHSPNERGPSTGSGRTEAEDFRAATGDDRPTEVKVFDYIYGVLHSPDYRETYKEFLKIDFPRIPYPASREMFKHISEKGETLRRLHLMEDAAIGDTPYPYHGEGDDVVVKPELKDGNVHINSDQYFEAVPEIAWSFYIGGYQPAQKWLKDRKGRTLSYDDIGHYQKIIKILCESDKIMKEINLPLN
ncbi:type ISP restriction/modification enzyme [Parasphingorhabdus sp.]|uniref:type ISP restriction/modification enzyme n=1 Tax=Parasphingorhabdus sp. TaxID=2709688 RepID=UPI003D2A2044